MLAVLSLRARGPARWLALAAVLGCADAVDPSEVTPPEGGAPVVARVEVWPRSQQLHPCPRGFRFTARAFDRSGAELPGRAVAWRSTNPSVALMMPDGEVLVFAPGSAMIVASAGAVEDTASLLITGRGVVNGIRVTPSTLTLRPGESGQLDVDVDTICPERFGATTYALRSSDTTVARVIGDALIAAVGRGTARITVSSVADPTITVAVGVTVTSALPDHAPTREH